MTDGPQTSSPKQGPINFLLKLVVFIMATFPIAIFWIFFFGKIYGTITLAVYLVLMLVLMWLRRRRRITESETLRRIDKVMGKPSDDPRQMAGCMR